MASKQPWEARRILLQKLLREMRHSAKFTQMQLAEKIRADQSFVSRYERGERRLDLVELADICDACGVRLSTLSASFESKSRRIG